MMSDGAMSATSESVSATGKKTRLASSESGIASMRRTGGVVNADPG